jgi:hypothetical protein
MRVWPLCAFVVISSCRFNGELQAGNRTRCEENADCPSGSKCISFGVCVQTDSLFVSKQVDPAIAGPNQIVRITLEFDKPRPTAPSVWAFTSGLQENAQLTNQLEQQFEYQWQVPAQIDDDQVVFVADGVAFNQRVVEIASISIDKTPPTLKLVTRQITPPSADLLGRRLRDISKVTNDALVEVVVQSSEALADPPSLWFIRGSERAALSLVRAGQTSEWRFQGDVGRVEGLATLGLTGAATDLRGNRAESSLMEVEVDTQPPPRPPVDTPNAIVFRRAPEGTIDTPNTPDFRLQALPGTLPPDSLVIVSAGSGIFARLTSNSDGSIDNAKLDLQDDLDTVSLRVGDEAGNLSTPVEVRDSEFVGYADATRTLFYHLAGPTLTEPFFIRNGVLTSNRAQAMPSLVSFREPVTSWPRIPDVLQSTFIYFDQDCAIGQQGLVNAHFWGPDFVYPGRSGCKLTVGARWPRLLGSVLAFDQIGSVRVDLSPLLSFVVGAFGTGLEGNLRLGEPGSYRALDVSLARRFPAATLDLLHDQVVLFGGESADGGVLGDTWLYTPGGQLTPAGQSGPKPPARKQAAMAYDPAVGKVILHGGNDGARTLSDTWVWNGQVWERLEQTQPIAREQHEMISAFGRAYISGGINNGSPSSPMAKLVGNEWSTKPGLALNIPSNCLSTGLARAFVTDNRLSAVCPVADGGTGYTMQPLDGGLTQAVPRLPFIDLDPTLVFDIFRLDTTRRFGLTHSRSEALPGLPPASLLVLSGGNWVTARNSANRPFLGACFVWQGEFACNDGNAVMLSNDAVVSLPAATRPIIATHIWPQSTTAWVASRTTDDNVSTRFEIRTDGTFRAFPGTFGNLAFVAYAGAPTGELFAFLRRRDGRGTIDVETFDGTNWVAAGVSMQRPIYSMPQAIEGESGRFFTFDEGQIWGASHDPLIQVSPVRTEIISKGIRPTLGAVIPAQPARCDQLVAVEVEAIGAGSAGGTPGFGVHMWDGFWFNPTPAIVSSPGLTRAKAVHRNPGAAYRFGETNGPVFNPPDFRTQSVSVRFSTQGASRGALDGELRIDAFQARYSCRMNQQP